MKRGYKRVIKITVRGRTEQDCDDALNEATARLKDGNVMGSDRCESSSFEFEAKDSRISQGRG